MVELLVVIAIVALLAGLLLPVLSRAKAKGKIIVCKNNLRQQGMALMMYADDYQKYPSDTISYGANGKRGGEVLWTSLLAPLQAYLLREFESPIGFHDSTQQRTVFHCPARGRRKARLSIFSPPVLIEPYEIGYVHNDVGTAGKINAGKPLGLSPIRYQPTNEFGRYLDPIFLSVTPAMLKAPADLILIGDSMTEAEWFRDYRLPWVFTLGILVPDVHDLGANMVFGDAHVEYAKQRKWVELSEPSRRRWNIDNEPHPETWEAIPDR